MKLKQEPQPLPSESPNDLPPKLNGQRNHVAAGVAVTLVLAANIVMALALRENRQALPTNSALIWIIFLILDGSLLLTIGAMLFVKTDLGVNIRAHSPLGRVAIASAIIEEDGISFEEMRQKVLNSWQTDFRSTT